MTFLIYRLNLVVDKLTVDLAGSLETKLIDCQDAPPIRSKQPIVQQQPPETNYHPVSPAAQQLVFNDGPITAITTTYLHPDQGTLQAITTHCSPPISSPYSDCHCAIHELVVTHVYSLLIERKYGPHLLMAADLFLWNPWFI